MTWRDYLSIAIAALCVFVVAIRSRRNPRGRRLADDLPVKEMEWNPRCSVFDEPTRFGYHVFTARYDRVVEAAQYRPPCTSSERSKLLGSIIESSSPTTIHLTRLLQERGIGRSLAACLLIDHSGSMRGKIGAGPDQPSVLGPVVATDSAAVVAVGTAISVAAALENCGAHVEILGFTTVDWRGGQSRRDWIASGMHARPGRLNDLLHIVYKRMDEQWVDDSSPRLEMLLDPSQLKENIDGEAIAWARKRLLAQQAEDYLLVVISDGTPVDDSTLFENGPSYLKRHLLKVIEDIERRRDLRVVAIGIGYGVSDFYPTSVEIEGGRASFDQQLAKIADLIGRRS